MAEFALGSIVTMAEMNPRVRIKGRKPYLGSHLHMYQHWRSTIALLVCIVGVHVALIIAVA
jgi:hypothetical protein